MTKKNILIIVEFNKCTKRSGLNEGVQIKFYISSIANIKTGRKQITCIYYCMHSYHHLHISISAALINICKWIKYSANFNLLFFLNMRRSILELKKGPSDVLVLYLKLIKSIKSVSTSISWSICWTFL